MTVIAVTVGLLFVYCKRRVGGLAALAPCLVLLVFGSDPLHALLGNGFTVVGSLGCGIGALLAVERDDLAGTSARPLSLRGSGVSRLASSSASRTVGGAETLKPLRRTLPSRLPSRLASIAG